jgi:hypothetical protein
MRQALPALLTVALAAPLAAAHVDYVRDVKPILRARCYACHGAVRQKSRLRLDAFALIRKGNRRGPVVLPGKADDSPLIQAVLGKERRRMPPESEGTPLAEKDVAVLLAWINQGATGPDEPIPEDPRHHWAFRPPVRPSMPAVPGAERTPNPVDAFVAALRASRGLHADPPAERAVLLRRVYLDLVGVPPTREELHAFLADTSPDAYEKVVDRLLASPRYGERWGRHWMDVWRYSDPFGLGEEYRYSQRHVWRWRDWIIESLNADKGYDRMILEMLAGDEVAPGDRDTLRATGYLARNWYKYNRNVWIQDATEYTAAGFLGLTMRCCRCHDHKYDPLSQQEYYRFRAFFEPHDVRIDAVPGQPDPLKDGVARAFDVNPAAPTYLFRRGDERQPDKSRVLTPGVPACLGVDMTVRAVRFGPRDYARALPGAAAEARQQAESELAAADADLQCATAAAADARRLLEQVASGRRPKQQGPKPFLHDDFTAARPMVWTVTSGQWAWEKGVLVCKAPSTFATVAAKVTPPADFMGRLRYRTTGGGIGSVGFSYDVAGDSFQAVYINAGNGSAVRAFHRAGGQDVYPAEGVVPHPVAFGEEVALDVAVRGDLLNTWVNGKLCNVYRLPIARRPGTFTIWAHAATAEFREVRLAELPASVRLADRPGEDRASPLAGPTVLTKADAERALTRAQAGEALARRWQRLARAALVAVEQRIAAEQVRYAEPADQARYKELALAAGRAERQDAALRAEEQVRLAEQAYEHLRVKAVVSAAAKKALAEAQQKLAAARKAHAAAVAAAGKVDSTYTPLVQFNPATSTGRRLALARWVTDRRNPLTARVAVNHIWMRHFGKPLVATVANFGLNGQKPTHPELLDWLAVELMESGWRMKHLHRLLVTSETYRLSSSAADAANRAADSDNRYLWRMNPRRMEAEAVRDSVLAVAGQLDPVMGGPILDVGLGQTSNRRSVYFRFNTEYRLRFLDQFDAASPTECYERRESVVPQQALALSNSALALNGSRLLAKQLTTAAPTSAAFVTAAFEQVLGRRPTAAEQARCERFLWQQSALVRDTTKLTPFPAGPDAVSPPSPDPAQRAREGLVRVLFNHNDFVTVR